MSDVASSFGLHSSKESLQGSMTANQKQYQASAKDTGEGSVGSNIAKVLYLCRLWLQ